jgi:hypothetical protein
MKRIFYIAFFISLFRVTSNAQTSNPDCPNGDAEANSFNNWATQMAISTAPTQNLNSFTSGFNPSRTGVLNSSSTYPVIPPFMTFGGVDQYGGFAVPSQGVYCFRIGNNAANFKADMLNYSFQVTPNNAHFKFRYAVVLEDGGHSSGENPWVSMYMTLGNTHIPNVMSPLDMSLFTSTTRQYVANTSDPYFKVSSRNSSVVYKDWQCVEYDLTPYIGATVTFNFIARDCTQGAHFGYAYLDGLCTDWPATSVIAINKTEFCDDGQPVMVDASASTGENRWLLEVAECDAAGFPIANGDAASQWYLGQQAPANINVNQFFNNAGKKFKCGKYYRVIVGVMNDCSLWHAERKIIHFNCPPTNAGTNLVFCCGNGPNFGTLSLGQMESQPGYTYQWSSYPTGFSSSQAQTTTPIPTKSTAYILTTRDATGCLVQDSVIIRYQNAKMKLTFKKEFYDGYVVCDLRKHYSAMVSDMDCPGEDPYFVNNYPVVTQNSIQWQFQSAPNGVVTASGTGSNFIAPNADGVTKVFVVNSCTSTAQADNVQFKQYGNSLIAPLAFSPHGFNTLFQIQDYGLNAPPLGTGPAYNAIDFKLYIFDRGGRIIRTVDKFTYSNSTDILRPLINGEIQWDGRNNQGNVVEQGTYNYFLNMKYCDSNEYVPACLEGAKMQNMCFNWALDFWGLNYVCTDTRQLCIGAVYLSE